MRVNRSLLAIDPRSQHSQRNAIANANLRRKNRQTTSRYGDLLSDLTGSSNPASLLENLIEYIEVDTTVLPAFQMNTPLVPTPSSGVGASIGSFLKPRVSVKISGVDTPYVVATPFGDPGVSQWDSYKWIFGLAGATVLGLAGYGAIKLLKK